MAFSNNEKISNSDKLALQITGTANAPSGEKFWYNEDFSWAPITPPTKLWNDFSSIPPASNPTEADTNVTNFPSLLEKKKIRLTIEPTSNNRAYLARTTYGDSSSIMLENWIQPSLIRTSAGNSSTGYIIQLFNGDPDAGGTSISTTWHSGSGGSPSWSFNYSSGILVCSTDEASSYKSIYDGSGLWVQAYRYIGPTGGSGGGGSSSPDVTIDGGSFIAPTNDLKIDCGSLV